MTAKILIVDDLPSNVKLLESKLRARYYHVVSAANGDEAIEMAHKEKPDIILLDVMMPGRDGFEVCQILKKGEETRHIPVVIITALEGKQYRLRGLESGADDFLAKPWSDRDLIARTRSLTRMKMLTDELRLRYNTARQMGAISQEYKESCTETAGNILVVNARSDNEEALRSILVGNIVFTSPESPSAVCARLHKDNFDLLIVDLLSSEQEQMLALCSMVRASEQLRQLPILCVINDRHEDVWEVMVDIGINDYVRWPYEGNEVRARAKSLIWYKNYVDHLRSSFENGLERAVRDPLTGMHNRAYLESHLRNGFNVCRSKQSWITAMIIDIDYFKKVNDTYGHAAGDEVLREMGARMRNNIRNVDLIARYGGEEFVVILPDTTRREALVIARRLKEVTTQEAFDIPCDPHKLNVTISIGIASYDPLSPLCANIQTGQALLELADKALYAAKDAGRDAIYIYPDLRRVA